MRDVHEGVVESRRPCIRRAAEVPVNGREVRKLVRKTPNIYITGVSTLIFTLDVLSTCHRDVHGSLMNVSLRTCWMCLDAMVDGVQAGWLILAATVDGSEEMDSSAGHVPETGFASTRQSTRHLPSPLGRAGNTLGYALHYLTLVPFNTWYDFFV